MCEYCGCQALTTIDELTREHEAVVDLIGHVRAARQDSDMPRMARTARHIADILRPHTQVEEGGVFPPLTDEFPEQIATLEAEHRRIEAVLAEAAETTPTDPTWPQRLQDTLRLLREHILKEQDGVFPAALANLDAADWEAAEDIRARAGTRRSASGH